MRQHELKPLATTQRGRHMITRWKCLSFIARLRFLINGDLIIAEKGPISTKSVFIGKSLS